jgi:hypothetical protein
MARTELIEQILDEGLRPTEAGEQGWSYTYYDNEGIRSVIWVTDAPLPADAIPWD